ncbi:MAG: uracil-DNA glycosylase family protein [Nostoc sp.]|uniref:uracil-DNA glycosylase family protein n=1 Tax=Nostoc sp. TaxID=1180 RepID=UPI002FF72545
MNQVINFYATVVNCKNSERECPNTLNMNRLNNELNNPALDSPPRGFYTEGNPENIQVMLIAKNPGHIINAEIGYYRGSPKDIAQKHIDWNRGLFTGNATTKPGEKGNLVFHKNILNYMSTILDVDQGEVFKYCVLTNLVKCSTIGEQDKLKKNTIKNCFQCHLMREMTFFNPKVIIAFGREVEKFLHSYKSLHGKPVIYVKHPSYHYKKDEKDSKIVIIKSEIRKYLNLQITEIIT